MKIAFFFDGTGSKGEQKEASERNLDFDENTIRVYIEGCQHKNVGNGTINPDLSIAANNIIKSFNFNGQVDLTALRENFGDAVEIEYPSQRLPVGEEDHEESMSDDENYPRGIIKVEGLVGFDQSEWNLFGEQSDNEENAQIDSLFQPDSILISG